MQARLVFTTATTIRPEILIIDEILGAGDAYFAVKSRSRMKQLVDSGASILLVAHAMDQILQFCEEAIWLERGRIVLRGPSLEVVKAYEEFIHTLQDRQLKAANRQRKPGFRDAVEVGHFADNFVVALKFSGTNGSRVDISMLELRSDVSEEIVRIGDPQDSDVTHFAYVSTSNCNWSEPDVEDGSRFRSLQTGTGGAAHALGELVFRSYALDRGKQYVFRIRYRTNGEGRLAITVSRNGKALIIDQPVPVSAATWSEHDVALALGADNTDTPADERPRAVLVDDVMTEVLGKRTDFADATSRNDRFRATYGNEMEGRGSTPEDAMAISRTTVRRWPGEGSLVIDDVTLLDAKGRERAVYRVGSALRLRLHYRAMKTGDFPVIFAVAIYRIDGIKVTQHVSPTEMVHMEAEEHRLVELQFPSVDLADGRYTVSVSLHRDLDPQFPSETVRYDLLSYSYQFEVTGNPPLRTSLFVLPAHWKM